MNKLYKLNYFLIVYKIKNALSPQRLPFLILKLLMLIYAGFVFFLTYESTGSQTPTLADDKLLHLFRYLNFALFILFAAKEFFPEYKPHQPILPIVYPNSLFLRVITDMINELTSFGAMAGAAGFTLLFILVPGFSLISLLTALFTILLSVSLYINLKMLIDNGLDKQWLNFAGFSGCVTAYVYIHLFIRHIDAIPYLLMVVALLGINFLSLISIYNKRLLRAYKREKVNRFQKQLNYSLLYSANLHKGQITIAVLLLIKVGALLLFYLFSRETPLAEVPVIKYAYYIMLAPVMFFSFFGNFFGANKYLWLAAETTSGNISQQKKIFLSIALFPLLIETSVSGLAIYLFHDYKVIPFLIVHTLIVVPLAFTLSMLQPYNVSGNNLQQSSTQPFLGFIHILLVVATVPVIDSIAFYYVSMIILALVFIVFIKTSNNSNKLKYKIFNKLFH
jgi:hypothetical protein